MRSNEQGEQPGGGYGPNRPRQRRDVISQSIEKGDKMVKGTTLTVMAGAVLVTAAWTNLAMAGEAAAEPKKSVAQSKEAKRIEVTVTPAKPCLLPDGRTKIVVKKESIYLGRQGRTGTVQVMIGDSVLDIVPRTVIATGGYRFEFSEAPQFQFGHVRQEDMIFTLVDTCTLTVLSSKQDSPHVSLKELKHTVELDCFHNMPCLEVHTIHGDGKHFVSFKPTMVEVSRFHPSTELGARLKMNVINNFGAKAIQLDYKKKTQVTIGEETITFESFGFDYKAKKLKIRIDTVPKTAKAGATIVEYGSSWPPARAEEQAETLQQLRQRYQQARDIFAKTEDWGEAYTKSQESARALISALLNHWVTLPDDSAEAPAVCKEIKTVCKDMGGDPLTERYSNAKSFLARAVWPGCEPLYAAFLKEISLLCSAERFGVTG